MASFGGFYKGEKKKYSKEELNKKAQKNISVSEFKLPELVKKKKDQ